jgi:hypothetical protein
MKIALRVNAVAVLALSGAYYWFFMFTKHSPPLAAIIPFGDDPYDAIGSFCVIVSALLALLSLVRAFGPMEPDCPPRYARPFSHERRWQCPWVYW